MGRGPLSQKYLERAQALDRIAAGRGQSLAQLAIQWVLRHDQVTSALIGASSVAQLENALAALTAPPLDPETLAAVEPYAVDGTQLR
jgi:L-glyceraldehyde 3-phosphate reductase